MPCTAQPPGPTTCLGGPSGWESTEPLTILGISTTPALLQMPLPSLTCPRHTKKGWHQTCPLQPVAEQTGFRGCLEEVPNGQTQGTGIALVQKAPISGCAQRTEQSVRRQGGLSTQETEGSVHSGDGGSVHSGVREPNHTKARSLFQSSIRKFLGNLR